jgi:hypothetical protein
VLVLSLLQLGRLDCPLFSTASEQFHKYHAEVVLNTIAQKFLIGQVDSVLASIQSKESKEVSKTKYPLRTNELEVFGDLAPFCEPYWYGDFYSPCKYRVWSV